ncbi:MAG: pilin [Candidatus Paceibacterota bacterium]|jgi:hypothetical protein
MKKKLIVLSGSVLGFSPLVALAQVTTTGGSNCAANAGQGTLFTVLCKIGQILNAVVPVLIALGVVYFVWGVITYVISSDEEAKKAGRDRIIFGIIGLAVIIAMWGLVGILTKTFDVSNSGTITLPTIN